MPRQEGGRLGYVDSEGWKSAEAVKLSEDKAKGDGGASAKTELKPRRDDGGTRAWGEKGGQSEWRLDGNLLRLSGSGTSLRSRIASSPIHFVSGSAVQSSAQQQTFGNPASSERLFRTTDWKTPSARASATRLGESQSSGRAPKLQREPAL